MANPSIKLTQGDFGFDLNFTITDNNDEIVNLTGLTVNFRVKKPGETAIINKECTLVIAASGTCKYSVVTSDLSDHGEFIGELEVLDNGISEITISPIEITIKQQLG